MYLSQILGSDFQTFSSAEKRWPSLTVNVFKIFLNTFKYLHFPPGLFSIILSVRVTPSNVPLQKQGYNAVAKSACTVGYNIFFVLLGKAVSSSCPIQLSPPTVVVKFGDPIFANCSSSSDQIDLMGWESEYGGTGVKEGVSSITLDIKSMQAWEITAQCFVNFLDGTQCSEFLPVTVYSK